MSFYEDYIIVTFKDDTAGFTRTSSYNANTEEELKAALADDFGYKVEDIESYTDDVNKMSLDDILDILEGQLEAENYHSIMGVPRRISASLSKRHSEEVVKDIIIELGDSLLSSL